MTAVGVKRVAQTPTISAASAYVAGDAVGGLLTFGAVTGNEPGGGDTGVIIESVTLSDNAAQSVVTDLVLFSQSFTPTADNAPFDPSDADLQNFIGTIQITEYAVFANSSAATLAAAATGIPSTADGNIYGQLVTRGGPTYAATDDLTVAIFVITS